ncbi:MAG: hypothetical protein GY929_18295 [Actinomycetia bacterium]|nr:hypothetical protein [Actinomycetes bacterium]
MEIRRLSPVFGAEIGGIQLADLDAAEFAELRKALADHEVLVLRHQDLDMAGQITFGERLGPLMVSPFSPNADDAPQLMVLDYHRENFNPLTDIWHSDETYRAAPPLATVLRAVIVPQLGGNTLFTSMTAAYDGLSSRMKAHIGGLTARHDFGRFQYLFANDPERLALIHRIELEHPHPDHPVVCVHPETGRPVLFVNWHFTTRINQLPDEEGRMILDYLRNRVLQPEYQLRIDWEPNTVVMWDNRSVQHYAPKDYFPQRRRMERVTVAGHPPVADTATSEVAPVEVPIIGVGGVDLGPAPEGPTAVRQFERTN